MDMTTTKPVEIEVGSKKMRDAYARGTEYYQPTMGGHQLEVEGGTTDTSLANLSTLLEHCGSPHTIEQGPNQGLLFHFAAETYLATGFGIGYGGTGPNGLATILMEMGLRFRGHSKHEPMESPEHNSRQLLLSLICEWDGEFVGQIFQTPLPVRALWRSDDSPNKLRAMCETPRGMKRAEFEQLEPIHLFGRRLRPSFIDTPKQQGYFSEP